MRSAQQRIDDALGRLAAEPNVWVATASHDGVPHLVPLSLHWDGVSIVLATPAGTPTVRNVHATGRARVALDGADDVVIIDALASAVALTHVPDDLVDAFVARTGWDPRSEAGDWAIVTLRPERVQAWNGVAEIDDRTLMRGGRWLPGHRPTA